uniref:Euchromatic histone-lysine N-methyltransferase 1b n=1 Tax=Petromyzon marinus TaxID=7757 RepID=S4RW98_PETMA
VRVNRARKTLPKPTPSQKKAPAPPPPPRDQGEHLNSVSQIRQGNSTHLNSQTSQASQPSLASLPKSPTRIIQTLLSVCVAVPAAPRKRKRKMGLYSFGQKKKGKPIRQRTLMEMLQGKVAQPERDGRVEHISVNQECDRASDGESDRDMADPSGDETQPPPTASGTATARETVAAPTSLSCNQREEGEVMDGDTEEDEEEGEESENHSDVSSGSSSKRKRAGGKQKGGNPWVKPNRRRSRVERQKYLQRSGQSECADASTAPVPPAPPDGDIKESYTATALPLPTHSVLSPHTKESRRSSDMEEGLQELPLCSCRMEAPKNREISKLSSGKCMATESTNGQLTRCLRSVAKQETMRPSSRVQLMVVCEEHRAKMMTHHCCPGCGFFCSTGTFLECQPDVGISHRFHVRCVSRLNGSLYCPHCGEEASAREVTVSAADGSARMRPAPEPSRAQAAPPAAAVLSASAAPASAPSGSEGEAPLSEGEVAGPATTLKSGAVISATGLPSAGSKELLEQALITLHTERPKKLRFNPKQLYLASRLGELQKVLLMLVEGLDPNVAIEGQRKRTPMHGAAERGHVEVLHTLVQAGGNIDACDQDQKTPLLQAAESNQLASTRYLVKAGAYVAHKDDEGATCLHLAAKKGNLEVVQYLVSTGKVNINCQDDGGWTPVIWTAEYKHVDVVRLLLSRGADVTLRDNEENICLHWAAFAGSVDIAEEFINAQCDLHAANLHGDTPLHIASRENHYECVVLLLARGANVDVRNKEGETPMECASVDSTVWLALQMNRKLREIVACRPARTERILTRDIARGYEIVPIPCVNGVDEEPPPADYKYLAKSCETSPMNIDCNITHLQHCSCADDCSSSNCLCGQLSIRCWYDKDGRLLPEFNKIEPPLIFECNHSCSCWRSCKNRVVQHGIR